MTEFELQQLLYEAIAEARANFDFWLAVSFAVLVGGHYTFSDLSRGLRNVALTLYGLVSLALFMRWIDAALVILGHISDIEQLVGEAPFNTPLTEIAFPLQSGIIFVGSVAVIYFLRRDSGHGKDT